MSKGTYKNYHKMKKKIKLLICIHYYHLRIVLFGIKFIHNARQQIMSMTESQIQIVLMFYATTMKIPPKLQLRYAKDVMMNLEQGMNAKKKNKNKRHIHVANIIIIAVTR